MSSIFSRIIAEEIPCYKIAEDDKHIAFLDINPLARGHSLVIPKQEIDYIFDMEDDALASLNIFAKKIAIALKKAINCERIGSTVIGLEVPHAHIHLVPINSIHDIDFRKERVQLSREEFESLATEIGRHIKH